MALFCYAVVLAGNLGAGCCQKWAAIARWIWTAGCLLLLAHIACAFHFFHNWQHTLAVEDTARQTLRLIGWSFGEGVYFNYAFAAVWFGDVIWLWAAPESHRQRSKLVAVTSHAYLFFIAVNGAIIFEDGTTRWVGILVVLLLAALLINRFLQRPSAGPTVNAED